MNQKQAERKTRRRFDTFEVALIVAFTVLVSLAFARWLFSFVEESERARLYRSYGPVRNSEHEEEWAIRDYFHDKRNGFFVDVGANDYRHFSNTYYLEESLGWSGIAVEPQREFESGYRAHRPKTRFVPVFIAEKSNEAAHLWVGSSTLTASADKNFTSSWDTVPHLGGRLHEVTVPTVTLDDLLTQQQVSHIDLLSIDIELHEPQALAGFDIDRFKPLLVCIEAHPQVRQKILDYFASHRYVIVGKYLRADVFNLYFAPLP